MMHQLGHERFAVGGVHATVDAWIVGDGPDVTVLLTNHVQPRQSIATELVSVAFAGAQPPASVLARRIDSRHANPQSAWLDMGAPQYLSPSDVSYLQSASRVLSRPIAARYENGTVRVEIDLPPNAVAAITLERLCNQRR
jgi:beta-xylosidase